MLSRSPLPWDLRFPWDRDYDLSYDIDSVAMCRHAYDKPVGMRHIEMGRGRYMSFVSFGRRDDYEHCNARHFWPHHLNKSVVSVFKGYPNGNVHRVYARHMMKKLMLLAMHGRRIPPRAIRYRNNQSIFIERCGRAIHARNLISFNAALSDCLCKQHPKLSFEFLDSIGGIISAMVGCPCKYCTEL